MQMSEIIDGLNSCEYPNAGGFGYPAAGCPAPIAPTSCGFDGGCGFGSWIWILLILFYTNNQGRNGCCKPARRNDCCSGNNDGCTSGAGGYLFLLVILFLCGGCGNGLGCGQGFDAGLGGIC